MPVVTDAVWSNQQGSLIDITSSLAELPDAVVNNHVFVYEHSNANNNDDYQIRFINAVNESWTVEKMYGTPADAAAEEVIIRTFSPLTIKPYRRLNPAGDDPREVARVINAVIDSLERTSSSFGAFEVLFDQAVSTDLGVWAALNLSFNPEYIPKGWRIHNNSELHPLYPMGIGQLFSSFDVTGAKNNTDYFFGYRVDGDDSTVNFVSLNSGTGGSDFIFSSGLNTPFISGESYAELVVSSAVADNWNVAGPADFITVSAGVDPRLRVT